MRRFPVFIALAAAVFTTALHAQTADTTMAATPVCPTQATLDQLVAAIDAGVSGAANKDRTCFRALFTADARLIPIRPNEDGTATQRILTVQGWIDAVAKRGSTVFYEKQIHVRTETWAHMAHLWSTYETRTTADGKPPEGKVLDRGINSIQAVYDGKQWRVIEIVWQAELPSEPVPAQYLP